MAGIAEETILAFLVELGRRYPRPTELLLLGGSALCLLGSPRPTLDIDYVGDDLSKTELQQSIDQVAKEMGIEVEAVPIAGVERQTHHEFPQQSTTPSQFDAWM